MEFDIVVKNKVKLEFDEFYTAENLSKAKSKAARNADNKHTVIYIREATAKGELLSTRIGGQWNDEAQSITCPKCDRKSYSQGDIDNKFCIVCGYHRDLKK
ncbi:hypothetical protein PE36_00255 [Moritella sp. PE36]|uniref:hypothetical protein n=1 Tax=Moritella sp. PE36 TaxID=58051 RepID=UPI00015693CF|nr:hypothetical protein [Moritella sp. PE36]EDM66182.1 hypothetical protein PE36_00255 [Moritella sp. PE36]